MDIIKNVDGLYYCDEVPELIFEDTVECERFRNELAKLDWSPTEWMDEWDSVFPYGGSSNKFKEDGIELNFDETDHPIIYNILLSAENVYEIKLDVPGVDEDNYIYPILEYLKYRYCTPL